MSATKESKRRSLGRRNSFSKRKGTLKNSRKDQSPLDQKEKMEVTVNTLEKVQKQRSIVQGEFLKICQKVSQATFAMSEIGSLFSNVVKEIASFFPPGDIGSVINDISGYSNDINEVFKLWSEKMRGEFIEGFMKSVDSMTKEMNDKIKEVQTKRAIFGKDISRAENFVFKAEKSQNEAQIASAVRDLNQKKEEIEKSESNLLLDVYLLQRRNGIFFIEKYIDFSQVYTLFGDVIRSLLTDVERWKSICSLKDLLTPEQIDTMQISREVQNLTDSTGNMEIHSCAEKFKVTEPYKSTRETRFQQHPSPPPLPKFPEDTTSPEGRSPRRPHVISPRSTDPRMGKLRSTSSISSPTHHREALSPRLNTSRGVIQEELDPPPPNYIPKPPGTQDIFENLTISWPTDIKHKPTSELSFEWDKQKQVEDKLQQVEEASTAQDSSTPRHKTTTVLSNTQQGIVEDNKGSGSIGGSTTTEPDFPCSLQEPQETLLFQNDLPVEKNNSSDSSVSLNRHNNNQEGISDKNNNQESERRFPTQRLTSRSVSIPHDCNLHSNHTVPSPVCRTATVSGRPLRTPKQDAEDRALCVELGSWQTPTYPNSWAVKDVTNRQGGLASPKQRMNPLFLSSPRSTAETSNVLVSPRSIPETSTVSTPPRAVIESMNPLQLQAISPSVSPDGDTPRRPLTQRMLSTKAIPRPSLGGQLSSSQPLLSSTSRDSPTSPRIPSPILRKKISEIPTGGSDNSDKRKLDIPILSLQQQDWDDIELLVDTNLSIVSDVL